VRGFEIRAPVIDGESCHGQVHIDWSAAVFDGHFPDDALLPGVAQIAILDHLVRALCGPGARVSAVENVRFRQPVRPGDDLQLRLHAPRADGHRRFDIHRDAVLISSGSLVVTAEPTIT
jgi:3-hydroxymyristoyl/3-hydroxydecanoyl-(acyl carrier protein) dehydratase